MSLQDSIVGDGGSTISAARRPVAVGVVRVNLIPPEIAEARRLRGVQIGLGGAVAASAAVVALLLVQQMSSVDAARKDLTNSKAENQRLQATQSQLGNVNALYAKVDAAKAMLASAQAPQVLWSRYLEDVRLRLPEKTWLTSLALTEAAPSAAAAAAPVTAAGTTAAAGRPAARSAGCAPVGTVVVAGSGYTHRDVADWLDRLAGLKAVTSPYLGSSTETLVANSVPTVTWTTTATLTCEALASAGKVAR